MGETTAHIWIDCYGRSFVDEIHLSAEGTDFSFIFNSDKKHGKSFSLAMYLDHAVMGNDLTRYPVDRRICLLLESPIYDFIGDKEKFDRRFRRVFTHRRSLFENSEKYASLYYGTSWLEGAWEGQRFDKTSLVSFLGSIDHNAAHGYSLRMDVARMCMELSHVDCYGKGINPIDSKLDGLGKYAFSIAMENVREDFYFSEKLIDCLLTDTVPIYWGCPSITELFDERGMILFESLDELADILRGLSMERYLEMLPFVRKNRDIAIQNDWHTLKGVYRRLARLLPLHFNLDDLPPISKRGKYVSSLFNFFKL
ncbi:glycosyltransferase family 10 domain-containing protein [Mariprofundus ferrooxydans]|uniref:glycosyltransferase family 10 domain-containing protein n=1 Tax=Mariprofundus ferrooxydans TaxID=314344 RepID=UPI00142FF52B|nr:glycosyltransferase family 10 [Mariprofundus ferrooxydans]